MKPLVSIVLPTFNGARYIDTSIASCLGQTHSRWELIIVDDGSTDATPEKIARFAQQDRRIRILRHPQNVGLPGALNSGFSHSTGHFLTWTSDDNCYRPRALEAMVDFLEQHPDVDLVYTDFTRIDENGIAIERYVVPGPETLALGNFLSGCFLYRRSVYEAVGDYDTHLFCAEDYDYWIRVAAGHRMMALHQDLYLYRRHPGALGSTRSRQVLSATEGALKRNLPNMSWVSATFRARGYIRLAAMARMRDDTRSARACLLSAVRTSTLASLRHAAPNLILWAMGGATLAAVLRRLRPKRFSSVRSKL